MSYQEKQAIVNIIGTILISAGFWLVLLQRHPIAGLEAAAAFQFWGTAFVIFVVVSVVAKVLLLVAFNIVNSLITQQEEDPSFTDERDQLISLKSTRNSYVVFAGGVVLAMGSAALGQPPTTLFVLLLLGGMTAEVVDDASKVYYYWRGV